MLKLWATESLIRNRLSVCDMFFVLAFHNPSGSAVLFSPCVFYFIFLFLHKAFIDPKPAICNTTAHKTLQRALVRNTSGGEKCQPKHSLGRRLESSFSGRSRRQILDQHSLFFFFFLPRVDKHLMHLFTSMFSFRAPSVPRCHALKKNSKTSIVCDVFCMHVGNCCPCLYYVLDTRYLSIFFPLYDCLNLAS